MIEDFESKIQVKTTIDQLKTPINRIDEFQAFNESILGFINTNKGLLPAVMQTLTPTQ